MHDAHGHGVKVRTAVSFASGQAEETEFPHGPHQVEVEPFEPVVLMRLRFNVLVHPLTHHLTQHEMGFSGVCNIMQHGAHQKVPPAVAI
jgi:hypothetical protein